MPKSTPPRFVNLYFLPFSTASFSGCCSLTDIVLPSALKTIEYGAFAYCSSLTEINLPDSLQEIGKTAFTETGLIRIDIPEGAKTIGENAFDNCYSLTSVSIPSTVTEMTYPFSMDSALEEITVAKDNPSFKSVDELFRLIVDSS